MVCRDRAHNQATRTTTHHFLLDAGQNLDVVRQLDGYGSARYLLLLWQYRQVAALLGCQPALEAIVRREEYRRGREP